MFKKNKFIKTHIRYPLEVFFAQALFAIFKIIPLKAASNFGARLARTFGPMSGKYRRLVSANLKIAFPKSTQKWRTDIAMGAWDMFGRMITEPAHFKHIQKNFDKYITVKGGDFVKKLNGKPFVVFTFHGGNAGIGMIAMEKLGVRGSVMYRPPNNPKSDDIVIRSYGSEITDIKFIPTDLNGAKLAMQDLQNGRAVIVAPDHRVRGAKLKFFGRVCDTPMGPAALARRFNCPLVPMRIVRSDCGLKNTITFYKPFLPDADDNITMQKINDITEQWIREVPAQWFWVHNRWGLKKDEVAALAD
ncbi:MAG: hypothetical protein FWC83_00555 [Alphaproteobacteria bacterium]|nr:hypothetical protein [Alphaproteobacteria bacterium]